jgi:DNA-binding transcriptional LysR family regulator
VLSIICPKWIGSLDLGDAIAAFSAAHPKIHVRFELGGMSDRTYDFLDGGFDVAFHTRDLRDSSVRLKKIASLPFVLCASRTYIERAARSPHPNDLAAHDCLVHVNDPVWRIGHGHASTLHKIRNVAFSSNSYIALQKAAVHGRGIALLPQRSAYDDLSPGPCRSCCPDLAAPDRRCTRSTARARPPRARSGLPGLPRRMVLGEPDSGHRVVGPVRRIRSQETIAN